MNLRKVREELMKDGWKVLDEEKYPYFLVKDRYKLDLDPYLTKLYWIFSGFETVTFIPVKQGMTYKQLAKTIRILLGEIEEVLEIEED